jgi:hypothetical protein
LEDGHLAIMVVVAVAAPVMEMHQAVLQAPQQHLLSRLQPPLHPSLAFLRASPQRKSQHLLLPVILPPLEDSHLAIAVVEVFLTVIQAPALLPAPWEDKSEIVVVVAAVVPVVEVLMVLLQALKLPLQSPARPHLSAQSEGNLLAVMPVVVTEGVTVREAALLVRQARSVVILLVVVAVVQVDPQTLQAHQVVSQVSHIIPRKILLVAYIWVPSSSIPVQILQTIS